ncbi:MAG: hypothetical protein Q4C64_01005 [Erysipelotrichia bacterium]|nr:hypothetical protein [Erysipelotrichia bacterium]
MINLFKKKKEKKAEAEEKNMQFMLDENTTEIENELLAPQQDDRTIVIDDSLQPPTEELSEPESVIEEVNLDDDEYEYVTPHYGKNAVAIVFAGMLVGIIAAYFVLKGSMSITIREELQNQGYMLTNGCNATAADIKEGKTAYIRGHLVTGTYVEIDTTQATATAADILSGYTAYSKGTKITGTIPTYQGSNIVTPSASDFKIDKGYYLPQDITIVGSGELRAVNIRKGVKIFGVTGTYEGD